MQRSRNEPNSEPNNDPNMILNKDNMGVVEMSHLTGSYYANNEFKRVEMDVEQAEVALRLIISNEVFNEAEELYLSGVSASEESEFVRLVQRPVALLAALNYFRKNDVSHEDSGRHVKQASDGTDKIPWEWQLDRDNFVHLEAYYEAVEVLIRFLNDTKRESWINSYNYKAAQSLLITSGAQFDSYFPINNSERLFILMLGFIREIQLAYIAPAYGKDFDKLVAERSKPESNVHFAACKACALLAMSVALRRLPLSVIPLGVVRGYAAENGATASKPATIREIRTVSDWIEADGKKWLGIMKDYRDGDSGQNMAVLPENNPKNKYIRL